MTAKNLPAGAAKASKKSRLPASGLLQRIAIYSAFVASIIASFYDFKLNSIAPLTGTESLEAKQEIAIVNKLQQAYHIEQGQFSDSLEKLSVGMTKQTENYNYEILSAMGPVQTSHNQREVAQFESTIAIARSNSSEGKSYTGAVFAFKENGSNIVKTITAICESDRNGVTLILPTFDGSQIYCPSGTTMLPNEDYFYFPRSR